MKLTTKQTEALLSATYNPNARGDNMGAYVIFTLHHITRKSLHSKGLMYGHYYLTRKGVETLAALSGNVVDMYGMEWAGNEGEEYIIPVAPSVEIQDMPSAPEFDAPGASECYYGCGSDVVAVFVDYVGRTEGICAGHRDRVEGQTYELPTVTPEASQTDAQSIDETQEESSMTTIETVNVVQAHMGMNGMNHYHAPGCRDIEREARRHNARKNMGVYEFPFSSVAAIIEHEYSDCNNGDAHDMVSHANDTFDGLKIMGCLRDSLPLGDIQGYPLMFTGARWMLGDMPLDAELCTICEVHGNVSENSTDIDGKHVCGYCVDNGRSTASLESHSLHLYGETEGAGVKYECGNCYSISTRGGFAEFTCDSEIEDAGFVETDSTDDYGTMDTPLSPGQSVTLTDGSVRTRLLHTVADSVSAVPSESVSTGTTHHTMDTEGNAWTRFDHVLTVGDVVKVVGSQGVYEVHCLIPGLPVVYVLGTQGEPFPVSAESVYAL